MAHQEEPYNKSPEQETPAWLLRVQEQSWEPEILVSGIVLYGLFQLPALLEQLQHFLSHFSFEVFSGGTADESMIAVLKVANVWLIGGFMVHLLLRSIWVALVGLSYVYKNGVDISRLKMGESYNRLIFKDEQYTRNIVRLEEICSTTFAVSFLLFMLLLGGCFFLGVVVALLAAWLYFFPNRAEQLNTIDPILSIIGGIYVLDFLTLGLLKRLPYFSKFYLPIYRVMSWLTLSPLYRKIYYGLVSNHEKWKSVLAILIFMSVTVLLYSGFRLESNPADALTLRLSDSAEQLMYPGHYANRAGDKPSGLIQIPSDVIESNVLSVFVVHRSTYEERYIKPSCRYDSRQDSIGHDTLVMDCLSRFYTLQLDGIPVEADYLFTRKQEPYQVGLQTYLDITHLEKGLHNLELYFQTQEEGDSVRSQRAARVEFYKAKPSVQSTGPPSTSQPELNSDIE